MMEPLMMLYMIALMYRDTKVSCVALAQCVVGVSHDGLTRLLQADGCWPTLLWRLCGQRAINQGGWLQLDDTVLEKWGPMIFGVFWVYSSRLQKVVRGINVVVLIWTDGTRRVPIGIKIWRRGGPSKVVLASKLLRWARRLGLMPEYVLFDSWYASKKLLQQVRSYGWHFVTRLRKNRKLAGQPLATHWPYRFGHGQVRARCLAALRSWLSKTAAATWPPAIRPCPSNRSNICMVNGNISKSSFVCSKINCAGASLRLAPRPLN